MLVPGRQLQRLRVFHNNCCRSMCRVTSYHQGQHRVCNTDLYHRLSLGPADVYYNGRLLRWVGHVARMDMHRTPRMLLTGWVNNPRPVGAPQMTYGKTVAKALTAHGLPRAFSVWKPLAQDRAGWRSRTHTNIPNKQQIHQPAP